MAIEVTKHTWETSQVAKNTAKDLEGPQKSSKKQKSKQTAGKTRTNARKKNKLYYNYTSSYYEALLSFF